MSQVSEKTGDEVKSHDSDWPKPAVAWTVAILLTFANSLAFVDRQILAMLVEPIKEAFQVSDTLISILYGLTFSLFYVAVGIPIARLADSTNRRNIVVAAISLWSVMTCFCGLAQNYIMLLLARIGVGAGEGGFTPAAQSLLADMFPKDRLPTALGLFSTGIYLGGGAALIIGGSIITHLNEVGPITVPILGTLDPWQVPFLIVGAPGMLLAAIFMFVKEPKRRGLTKKAETSMSFQEMKAYAGLNWKSYAGIILGLAFLILVGQSGSAWIPAFFQRKFDWDAGQIGAAYGPVVVFCGASGALLGGFVASYLKKMGHVRANLIAPLFAFGALIPVTILYPLMSTPTLALILIGVMNFCAGFPFGGCFAALQEITPNRMRAQVVAIFMLGVNLLGAGLGPTIVALITDIGFGDSTALPYSLAITNLVFSPLAFILLILGFQNHVKAIETVKQHTSS